MSEKQLIAATASRFHKLSKPERVRAIRELASKSREDEAFIRKTFPDLYAEAFPAPSFGKGGRPEEDSQPALQSGRR